MSDCRNPERRRPPLEIMRRVKVVDDTGLIPFVDTEAAARYLSLSPHSLEYYRSLGGGPPFYKFGKFVRYAVPDLKFGSNNVGTVERQARITVSTKASGASCPGLRARD